MDAGFAVRKLKGPIDVRSRPRYQEWCLGDVEEQRRGNARCVPVERTHRSSKRRRRRRLLGSERFILMRDGRLQASGPPRAIRPSDTIRVASVPASHVYVRHLSSFEGADGVVRLRDIPPSDGVNVPGGWWPPAMLDPQWVVANHATFDVFHVHFGFDAKTPGELRSVAEALHAARVPLVVTVHDLRNPHHTDTDLHDAQLEVLLEHAAAVITLTPGAAQAIAARWGRTADVLPHPHVVEWDTMARPRIAHDGFVIGLHAKSLRANMNVTGVAAVLATAVRELPGARLQIDLHHEVFARNSHFFDPVVGTALRRLAVTNAAVELREHEYFADDELWDYFLGLDVSVLPYRFGTHSGWLEACHDVGTAVVAPTCGFYAQQQPAVLSYQHDEDGLGAASLSAAIRRAYELQPAPRADIEARKHERRRLAAAHRALYSRLME